MATLPRELRRSLENTVREARRVAESGARKVIEQLAVHHHEPYTSMTPELRGLRNALRAHGRQLGDRRDTTRGTQAIERLKTECAYEHWHRMLFARFLAETNLLIEPESGMDITLEDCQELARERGEDWLELASQFAERMLPQIFRTDDPVLKVALPPETRAELEKLLKALSREVFIADDSLGWVYQYWQADKKDEVNRSEKKIGADELPAVTQLFTEDYMVFFLLHNTLGAWWAGKILSANPELASSAKSEDELRAACSVGGVEWAYLRFVREGDGAWRPAAGSFANWPRAAKDITVLDPCMGSGHFLVFALPMLAALRAEEEGLSVEAAIEAVLRDNLFGLEIDPRCTQIAVFNLALAAWRRVGHRALPALHLACSGLSLGVTKVEWMRLAERAASGLPVPPKADLLGTEDNLFSDAMKRGVERLYDLFTRAPWLGSLIEPHAGSGDLIEQGFVDLQPILAKLMVRADIPDLSEMAVAAQGLAKAAEILGRRFILVATNVPYLGRGKQDDILKEYCDANHASAKSDLATCFVERCLTFCSPSGVGVLVTPQIWWFAGTYAAMRKHLLKKQAFRMAATLGEEAWQSFGDRGPFAGLLVLENSSPDAASHMVGIDALPFPTIDQKIVELKAGTISETAQSDLLANPDSRITVGESIKGTLLSAYAKAYQGIKTGDDERFCRQFWELPRLDGDWRAYQAGVSNDCPNGGMEFAIDWSNDGEELARRQGLGAVGKEGILVCQMRSIPVSRYFGDVFSSSVTPIIPADSSTLPAIWAFCSSPDYRTAIRKLDKRVSVTTATLTKVPFDLGHWQEVAAAKFPNGLSAPASPSPTQWIFDGNPKSAEFPLQVAVARVLGYQWPRHTGSNFSYCGPLGADHLEKHADQDGIVALSPVKGEAAASERVTALLADAFGSEWSAAKLANLLTESGSAGVTLGDWLRDNFFVQHCEAFQQRPFIWHVWDGRRDGFHALVNYHRLAAPDGKGRRTLEKLIYTFLGDWIDQQRGEQQRGVDGADGRVAAAESLKTELENILAGEPPYDIFVRWKSISEQPIGWDPDINVGVRVNIRPFLAAKPLEARARGACILRTTPKIKLEKDRGKESQLSKEDFPWLWGWDEAAPDFLGGRTFDGNRWNDLHYSRAVKEAARTRRNT